MTDEDKHGLSRPSEAGNTNGDEHLASPDKRWEFDAAVTANFPAMLSASIPALDSMRMVIHDLATRVLTEYPNDTVIDIGASRGDAVASLVQENRNARFALCEVSDPMSRVLATRFGDNPRVRLLSYDLSENVGWIAPLRPRLVLSVLTLMFIPMENRQRLIQAIHDGLESNGTFLIVEKTLGDSAGSQELLVRAYHDFKKSNGYSDDAVERKRMSLKGSLVPCKASWTEDMLRDAGFRNIQQAWRCLQFVGWVCNKN